MIFDLLILVPPQPLNDPTVSFALEDLGLGGYNFFRSLSTHRACHLVRFIVSERWEEWT